MVDIGAALHQHGGVDALHLKVVGGGHPLLDAHIAAYEVKRKAFAEHVAKIQREAPREGLQAEHTQQLGQTGFGLEELARLHVDVDLPGHGPVVGAEGGANPGHLALQATFAPPDHVGHAHAGQQVPRVADVQPEAEHRAPLCRPGAGGRCVEQGPVATRGEAGFGCEDVEPGKTPFALRPIAAPVAGLHLHAAQAPAAQLEVVHDDVQRRQGPGLLIEQRLDLAHVTLRHVHPREPGKEQPVGVFEAARLAVFEIAVELGGVEVGAPCGALAQGAGHDVVQRPALQREFAGAHGHGGGQVVLRHTGRPRCRGGRGSTRCGPAAGGLRQHIVPGVHIDFSLADIGRHALGGHRCGLARRQTDTDRPPKHAGLRCAHVPHIGCRPHRPQIQRDLVVQRRCLRAVA